MSLPFKEFAERERFVILAPSFTWDQANWNDGKSYQYPEAWSGAALVAILDRFQQARGISISKLYLFGFSAGAQFAVRFALLRPELCAACAALYQRIR